MEKETLEKAAHEYFKRGQLGLEKAADTEMAFIKGAKWQVDRMINGVPLDAMAVIDKMNKDF